MKITSFKHKGLEAFYTTGSRKGIMVEHATMIESIFAFIDNVPNIEALEGIPALKLHQLKDNRDGIWSMTVRANWRITLAVNGDSCELLNYEDYH
jgi:proteic killer suppression protein